jgi:phosphatidylglycerophosphate synthase
VSTVRTGPLIGLIMQIVLLAGLAGTVGLGTAGWLVGVVYGAAMCAVISWGLRQSGSTELGPADQVTLARATLVGAVAALTVDSFDRPAPVPVLVTLATVALMLDAVDGQVARRTGTVSAFGARFDMEVDAFLLLVLAVYVMRPMGAWVLAMATMRYAFMVASWLLPWMQQSLPPRYWRKVVAATQGIVLVLAAADVLPRLLMAAVLAATLAPLVESFGRDIIWLWRHRAVRPTPRPGTVAPAAGVAVATRTRSRLPLNVRLEAVAAQTKIVRNRANSGGPRPFVPRSGHPVLLARARGGGRDPG